MKKFFALALSLALALTAFAGCSSTSASTSTPSAASGSTAGSAGTAASGELNLYTWEGMFPQEVLDAFTAETGIKVNYSSFDTDETMLAKLETAKGGDYDVVIADDYIIETAIAEGLVMELDKSKIANIGNVNPVYQGQFFDPEDAYTVPYGAGVQTIVYNPDLDNYKNIFQPVYLNTFVESFKLALTSTLLICAIGYPFGYFMAKLLELAPNIRLIKDDNLQDDLISGEISAGVMYTSQVTMACLANPDLKVVYPSEGIGFGIMAQFVPVNAPNPDAAHAFIDYILRPEVSKQCFEYIGYYCTNQAADALIEDAYQSFLTLPEDFSADNMEMIQNISAEAMEAHTKVWTEFRTACGQ